MAKFFKKRLNRFLNSPYKISEVEAEIKRFTRICATLSEEKHSPKDLENRGQLVNQILKARREGILSQLHAKSNFEEQRNFWLYPDFATP